MCVALDRPLPSAAPVSSAGKPEHGILLRMGPVAGLRPPSVPSLLAYRAVISPEILLTKLRAEFPLEKSSLQE